MPQVRSNLLQLGNMGRCPHAAGAHQPLIGKQDDGSFATARAKIYPPMLNDILGRAMHDFANALAHPNVAVQLPDEFEVWTNSRSIRSSSLWITVQYSQTTTADVIPAHR